MSGCGFRALKFSLKLSSFAAPGSLANDGVSELAAVPVTSRGDLSHAALLSETATTTSPNVLRFTNFSSQGCAPKLVVILNCDKTQKVDKLIQVMDEVKRANAENVLIATEPKTQDGGGVVQ